MANLPRVTILSGAGLSAPSGIPTFRDNNGLWENFRVEELATPEAWRADQDRVTRFYDWRRANTRACQPNEAHKALERLQAAWGPDRVTHVTQNVDGMMARLSAPALEMHGSNERLRCGRDARHPCVPAPLGSSAACACAACGAALRPDVVWFGETPRHLEAIDAAVACADLFVSVGTSGTVYPAAGLVHRARECGVRTLEVNPKPTPGGNFDAVLSGSADVVLPRLVRRWLETGTLAVDLEDEQHGDA
ncbi:silent information regulator protein Sir2 [Tribonema minus]|uniref:Silent information regulator protein Sir2 n=1 Tax=Tribonema minus TaxID=303371 RepID=A0A836C9Q0_9STRA|nr:silent information regulator protein Sir2 [Tribonema minus]